MRTSLIRSFGALAALLLAANVNAEPILQIDIGGGSYVGGTEESVVTTDEEFTVYALGTPSGNVSDAEMLETTYYLAVALIPQTGPDDVDCGSFVVGGATIDCTEDMTYGNPPIEAALDHDGGDLGPHGVYETFFIELAFTFNAANTSGTYNVQDDPGIGPQPGTGSYFQAFSFDIGGLTSGYDLHFDLYNTVVKNGGDVDSDDFAPFSHDGRTDCCDDHKISEPGTLGLLGLGLLAVGYARRRTAA